LTTESVDDTSNRGSSTLADEVKVKHALHGTGLHAIDETSRLWVEEQVLWVWAGRSRGSNKAADVVIWLLVAVAIRLCSIGLRDGGAGRTRRTAYCGHCDLRRDEVWRKERSVVVRQYGSRTSLSCRHDMRPVPSFVDELTVRIPTANTNSM